MARTKSALRRGRAQSVARLTVRGPTMPAMGISRTRSGDDTDGGDGRSGVGDERSDGSGDAESGSDVGDDGEGATSAGSDGGGSIEDEERGSGDDESVEFFDEQPRQRKTGKAIDLTNDSPPATSAGSDGGGSGEDEERGGGDNVHQQPTNNSSPRTDEQTDGTRAGKKKPTKRKRRRKRTKLVYARIGDHEGAHEQLAFLLENTGDDDVGRDGSSGEEETVWVEWQNGTTEEIPKSRVVLVDEGDRRGSRRSCRRRGAPDRSRGATARGEKKKKGDATREAAVKSENGGVKSEDTDDDEALPLPAVAASRGVKTEVGVKSRGGGKKKDDAMRVTAVKSENGGVKSEDTDEDEALPLSAVAASRGVKTEAGVNSHGGGEKKDGAVRLAVAVKSENGGVKSEDTDEDEALPLPAVAVAASCGVETEVGITSIKGMTTEGRILVLRRFRGSVTENLSSRDHARA